MNLAGADGGDLWRRHRRIMGPSFNNKTYVILLKQESYRITLIMHVCGSRYAFVWDETLRIYNEMLRAEGWLSQSGPIDIASVQTYTFKVSAGIF